MPSRLAASCWLLPLWLNLSACSKDRASEPEATKGSATVERFGEPLSASSPRTSLDAVLNTPSDFEGKRVTVEGNVRRACSRKGCWMELASTEGAESQGCRITFKNYGFFVPTDSAGASATVEGTVQLKRVPSSRVTHLEKEGAVFAQKNADGSADEVQLIATGVELVR